MAANIATNMATNTAASMCCLLTTAYTRSEKNSVWDASARFRKRWAGAGSDDKTEFVFPVDQVLVNGLGTIVASLRRIQGEGDVVEIKLGGTGLDLGLNHVEPEEVRLRIKWKVDVFVDMGVSLHVIIPGINGGRDRPSRCGSRPHFPLPGMRRRGDSGPMRVRFRGEGEQHSGRRSNSNVAGEVVRDSSRRMEQRDELHSIQLKELRNRMDRLQANLHRAKKRAAVLPRSLPVDS